jgi:hypothetical protein
MVGSIRTLTVAPGDFVTQIWLRFAKPNLASLRLLLQPHANPSTGIIVVQKEDSSLFESGLNPHQGRDVAHDRAFFALDPPDSGDADLRRFRKVTLIPA